MEGIESRDSCPFRHLLTRFSLLFSSSVAQIFLLNKVFLFHKGVFSPFVFFSSPFAYLCLPLPLFVSLYVSLPSCVFLCWLPSTSICLPLSLSVSFCLTLPFFTSLCFPVVHFILCWLTSASLCHFLPPFVSLYVSLHPFVFLQHTFFSVGLSLPLTANIYRMVIGNFIGNPLSA